MIDLVFYSVTNLDFLNTYTITSLHLAIITFLVILVYFRKYNERCDKGFSKKSYKGLVVIFLVLSFTAPLLTNYLLYSEKEHQILALEKGEFKVVNGKIEKLKRDSRGTGFEVNGVKFFHSRNNGFPLFNNALKRIKDNMIVEIKYLEQVNNPIIEIQEQ